MYTFSGLAIFTGSQQDVVRRIDHWIRKKKHSYICVTGAHGVAESHKDTDVMRAHKEAGLIVPDGMPLVWLGRLSGYPETERIYGPDLFLDLCRYAQKENRRVFLYGTTRETLKKLFRQLESAFPDIRIAGSHAPPFRRLTEPEKNTVVRLINAAKPDIVFVGLSTPKQELWMYEFSKRLNPVVCVGVGAALDFIAGTQKQAPRWLRRSGLEWTYRLIHDPKRLTGRYRFVIWRMLMLVWRHVRAVKQFHRISHYEKHR